MTIYLSGKKSRRGLGRGVIKEVRERKEWRPLSNSLLM